MAIKTYIKINKEIVPLYEGSDDKSSNKIKAADKLDEQISDNVKNIIKSYQDLKNEDLNVLYWHIGKEISAIIDNAEIESIDLKWIWNPYIYHLSIEGKNVLPKYLFKENRRIQHIYLFYKNFNLKDVKQWNWSEWATIFDSISFLDDERSFIWLKNNFNKVNNGLKGKNSKKALRNEIRPMMRIFNNTINTKGRSFFLFSDDKYYALYDKSLDWIINNKNNDIYTDWLNLKYSDMKKENDSAFLELYEFSLNKSNK